MEGAYKFWSFPESDPPPPSAITDPLLSGSLPSGHSLQLWPEVPVELIQLLLHLGGRRYLVINRYGARDVVPHGLLFPLGAVINLRY